MRNTHNVTPPRIERKEVQVPESDKLFLVTSKKRGDYLGWIGMVIDRGDDNPFVLWLTSTIGTNDVFPAWDKLEDIRGFEWRYLVDGETVTLMN